MAKGSAGDIATLGVAAFAAYFIYTKLAKPAAATPAAVSVTNAALLKNPSLSDISLGVPTVLPPASAPTPSVPLSPTETSDIQSVADIFRTLYGDLTSGPIGTPAPGPAGSVFGSDGVAPTINLGAAWDDLTAQLSKVVPF